MNMLVESSSSKFHKKGLQEQFVEFYSTSLFNISFILLTTSDICASSG